MDLIDAALRSTKQRPRMAYVAPQLKQAKSVVWDYLLHYGLKIPGATKHETELRLDLPNQGQVRLYGADNPDALRGQYFDALVLDEAADHPPRLFPEILRPALSDRKGSATWIGSAKGQNDFYDLVYGNKAQGWVGAKNLPQEWYFDILRASQTGIVPKDELDDARRMMSPEQYLQEYECSFSAAIIGAYYGKEMDKAEAEGRMTTHVLDPGLEVHTAWDLGMSDHTVIWFFQQAGFEIRVVDVYANNGFGLDHYAKVMQERGYRYGRHHLPHDVAVRELSAGGRSRIETLSGLGIQPDVGLQRPKEDSINAVRRILPRCWFDREKCEEGIKGLRQYRRHWDEQRKVFVERPFRDWTTHFADAFAELAVGADEPNTMRAGNNNYPKRQMAWVV